MVSLIAKQKTKTLSKPQMVLRKALHRRNASFHTAELKSGVLRHCATTWRHSPSRSISKTLMASCVLSGRTSLAGSVCLLWTPGETEGGGCISLMKGCAPATDIVHALTSPLQKTAWSPLSAPAQQDHLCRTLRGQQEGLCVCTYRTAVTAVIHQLICI